MLDTLANVKSRLGITDSDYDTFLTSQISLISSVIEAYCRRKFLTANYKQTFYRDEHSPTKSIQLYQYPVQSITTYKEDGENFTGTYRINKESGYVVRDYGLALCAEITEITYVAGYATCPLPVLAVLDALVSERYNKKKSGVDLNFGSDVQRISIAGAISIDFDYSLSNNDRKSSYGTIIGNYSNVLDDWRSERSVIGTDKLEYVEEV